MKMRPNCYIGRGKTLTDADRLVLVGVLEPAARQRLLPAFFRVQLYSLCSLEFCFVNNTD